MEVHHHAHTARKKWTHYFWEFFMLFLAVFCGFLAEYKLEHVIEHSREKQYMRTLLEDLKKDTASLEESIKFWETLSEKIETTRSLLKQPPIQSNREAIYETAARLIDFNDFIYFDRTIEQLRNSGNFRLISNRHVSDTLIGYDSFIRGQLREQEATLIKLLMDLLRLQNELFDSDGLESKFRRLKNSPTTKTFEGIDHSRMESKDKMFLYYNSLFLYNVGISYLISSEKGLKKLATGLIELVKKEYSLSERTPLEK